MQTEIIARTQAMARLAGFSYVAYVALGLYVSFGPVGEIWKNGVTAQTEFFFRTGLVAEMALYIFVVLAAAAMYCVLRGADRNLAFVAAGCRLVEGALGSCFLLLKYAAFVALTRDDLAGGLTVADREGVMMLFKHVHGAGLYFTIVVMGVGGAVYFWLFYRTRLIPCWLAAWGVFTYGLMIVIGASVFLFALLFGSAPRTITGAGEGMALGAAIGVGVWITQARGRRATLTFGALLTAAAGTGATLLGGQLMGGSFAALEAQFPASDWSLGA
ncbi:MAG: DUF4386 domain-containing protein [Proteobacteria bacterium]|nr:DUF4386 domain-containing protein [Pseudomonadota bacterium]